MQLSLPLRIGILAAAVCLRVQGQNAPDKDAQLEAKGMPPRATPGDYQTQAQAGAVTIAAEFQGHSIPTPQGALSSESYIAIEVGVFGAPGTRLTLSPNDFTLRINGKKSPLRRSPYGLVISSVKDPEWEPPEPPKSKSRGTLTGGGSDEQSGPKTPPEPVPVPIELQRAMAKKVQKASLPEGDRALPQAGLIFFEYWGKVESIHSMELIYAGPAGKATLTPQAY